MRPRLRTVIPLLLALAACARRPPLPPPATPAVEVREVDLANGWLTVRLEIPASPPGRKPAIIGADDGRDVLLAAGAVLVSHRINWHLLKGLAPPGPPPPPPKNTVGAWLLAAPTPKTVGQGYFQLLIGDATQNIPKVIDYLETVPEIDPTRIGITGHSTNGFRALQAVAADRRLSVAVIVTACGDYHTFLHLSTLGMKGEPLDLDPAYDRWLSAQEPMTHAGRLVHAAILMVNGVDDTAVPASCAANTARAFRRAYARAGVPDRFRWLLFPNQGHVLGDDGVHQSLAWWFRWLLRPR